NDYRWIEPGTGEYSSSGYYFSDMGILIPYATKWSNGSYTLSTAPYEGVNYLSYSEGDNNIEFNDTSFVSNGRNYEAGGTEPDYWEIGTAPAGRTESDYAYDSNTGKYVYNGGSSSSNNAPQQSAPSTPVEQVLEELSSVLSDDDPDDEDVNGNVNENDGNTLRP
ncbi:MAG: hypothetical protein LBJ00_07945, partial [Planctomycetaceae bacterium]|nr:hypothetical protein [Planctomycetaceae bacterium]